MASCNQDFINFSNEELENDIYTIHWLCTRGSERPELVHRTPMWYLPSSFISFSCFRPQSVSGVNLSFFFLSPFFVSLSLRNDGFIPSSTNPAVREFNRATASAEINPSRPSVANEYTKKPFTLVSFVLHQTLKVMILEIHVLSNPSFIIPCRSRNRYKHLIQLQLPAFFLFFFD